jgi:hypothetical protein
VIRAVVGLTWGTTGDGVGDVAGVAAIVVADADDDGATGDGSSVGVGPPQPAIAITTATAQLVRSRFNPGNPLATAPSLRLLIQPTGRTMRTAAVLHRYRSEGYGPSQREFNAAVVAGPPPVCRHP